MGVLFEVDKMDFELTVLKHFLKRKGISYSTCAEALGIDIPTFSNKINGKEPFKLTEVQILARFLHLGKDDIYRIFFI